MLFGYGICQTVSSRRLLTSWSFRPETTRLFPGAHRSAPGPELQKCACAHTDSTDIMAVWQDRAFTSTLKHKRHSRGKERPQMA